jgi:antitoxin component of RelBE/YafQ-DinJ toxin-antitoxin module
MVLKTFNVQEEVYDEFSKFCKENGISMSKQVEIFMEAQLATEPKVRQEYLEKLDMIRKGKFIKYGSVDELRKATS